MAIATLVAPFARFSGKVTAPGIAGTEGGVVCMPDADGRTLTRSLVQPANPQTAAQLFIRAAMTSITEAYQTLTLPQAEAWQAIAETITRTGRLGLNRTLSWTQLFQSVNSFRIQAGEAIAMDPPTLDSCTLPSAISVVASDDGSPDQTVEVKVTEPSVPAAGSFIAWRFTRDLGSAVRLARKTDYRYATTLMADSILPRQTVVGGGVYTYTLATDNLNVLGSQHIGVVGQVLTPHYYPAGIVQVKNILVDSV